MKILTGDLEVYASGIVNSDENKPIRFVIIEKPRFEVVLMVELNKGTPAIDYNVTGEGEITFVFQNPNLMNFGFSPPVKIGFVDGRELSAIFRVTMHGPNASYSLAYTFFLKVPK